MRALISYYLRFKPKLFFFLSQGPSHGRVSLALRLCALSWTLVLIVGVCLAFAVGGSIYEAVWNVIKTGIVFLPIAILPLYVALRFLARVRVGLFLINLASVANVIWILTFFVTILLGVILSGSFARDVVEIRAGRGRPSAVYEVICKPIDLQIQYAEQLRRIDDLTGEVEFFHEIQSKVEEGTISKAHAVAAFKRQLKESEGRLTVAQQGELVLARLSRETIRLEQELTPTDHSYDYFMTNHLPVLIAVGISVLVLLPLSTIWTTIFLFRGVLSEVSERGRRWIVTAVTAAGYILSGAVAYGYVMLAEGTPDWDGPQLAAHIQDLQVQSRRLELICGRFDSRGLW
jgi:hypothetical protein